MLGVAFCVAARELVEEDRIRRRTDVEQYRACGDHEEAIRAACRPPEPGWLLVCLSLAGGVAMVQGFFWFYEAV